MKTKTTFPVGTLMQRMTTTEGAVLMSIDVMHQDIVNGKYKNEVEAVRRAYSEGTMAIVKEQGVEKQIPLHEKLKKALPYFVPQADVRRRRIWEEACDFTGFAPIDCDHLTDEEIERLMNWARRQPWVKEGHRSCRNEGVHLIVAMGIVEADNKKDYDREYKRRYRIISEHIQRETGITVDGQCKDVLRGFFVSYDPQAFIRKDTDVRPFNYPEATDNQPQEAESLSTQETKGKNETKVRLQLVNGYLSYHEYLPQKRHAFWVGFGQRLRYKNVDRSQMNAYREFMKALLESQGLVLADDPLRRSVDEVDKAMAWGYDHSEEAQEDKKPKKGKRKSTHDDEEDKPNTMEQIHDFLSHLAQFRFNAITEQVEILEAEGDGQWREMDDTLFLTYYDRVKRSGIKTNKADTEAAIRSLDYSTVFNPVTDYLESLDPWTPDCPDHISELFSFLEYESDEERQYVLPLLRKWFVCMVALWLGKVDDNQMMPVIRGEQNVGKSFFIRHLLPPQLRQYYKEIQPGDKLDKDQRIAMSRFLLISFEEFTLAEKNSSNQTKAFISSAASTDRAAYGRFQKVRKRKASLIASCNDEQFILDKRGSRRYLAFTISGTRHIDDDSLPYASAYAQAYYLANHLKPKNYRPTKTEAETISANNRNYTRRTMTEIFAERYFRKPRKGEQGIFLTMGDILQKLSYYRLPDLNEINVGRALSDLSITKQHTRNGNRYYVVEITPQYIEEEGRRLGEEEFRRLEDEENQKREELPLNLE
jgi:predicted P-loop ATPase